MTEENITIKCLTCSQDFVLTTGEQAWYTSKMMRTPSHCPACRVARRNNDDRVTYDSVCHTCGSSISLPFVPKPDGTYYCKLHYVKKHENKQIPNQ